MIKLWWQAQECQDFLISGIDFNYLIFLSRKIEKNEALTKAGAPAGLGSPHPETEKTAVEKCSYFPELFKMARAAP